MTIQKFFAVTTMQHHLQRYQHEKFTMNASLKYTVLLIQADQDVMTNNG